MAQTLALPARMPPLSAALMTAALTVLQWELRHRSRKALARLDDHMLRDIGMTPDHAGAEAIKPFWRD